MNGPLDTNEPGTADEGGGLDPREAATLLTQTRRQARRQFAPQTPVLALIGAAFFLVAYGTIWLSVRGQHPYQGPSGAALSVFYGLVIVVSVAGGVVFRRAATGVSGRAVRQQRAQGAAVAAAYVGAVVFQGALHHLGVSNTIVYGVFPAAATLIVVGAAGAAIAASRENWPGFGVAIAVIVVCAGSAYAGPISVWAFVGVGCCVAFLAYAAAQVVWLRRA
jgi:hypothetical protein